MHHRGDELHAVPLRRGGETVEGCIGGAGLQPRGPFIIIDQLVCIGQLKGPVPQGVHPDGGELPDGRVVQDELPAHDGDVPGGGKMPLGRQARTVDKMGVVHVQLRRPLVHPLDEGFLRPRQMLRQRHGAVVGGHHRHRLHHVVDGHLLMLLQPDLAAPHAHRVGGGGHRVVPAEAAAIDSLQHQQQGHHLGHGGRLVLHVGVVLIQHRPRGLFHQDGRRGGQARQLLRPGEQGQRQGAQQRRKQKSDPFHRASSPFSMWSVLSSYGIQPCPMRTKSWNFRFLLARRPKPAYN